MGMRKHVLQRWRCRMVSWMVLFFPVLLAGTVLLGVKWSLGGSDLLQAVALFSAIFTGFVGFVLFVESFKLNCPVCFGSMFRSMGCVRHKSAPRVLGSTRLGFAIGVIFSIRAARCRYCNTHFMLHLKHMPGPPRSEIATLLSSEIHKPKPVRSRFR